MKHNSLLSLVFDGKDNSYAPMGLGPTQGLFLGGLFNHSGYGFESRAHTDNALSYARGEDGKGLFVSTMTGVGLRLATPPPHAQFFYT